MATQVQRITGPQPIEARHNGEISWMIPLSAMPTREWLKFFNTPSEPEGVCMPSRVAFRERTMVFSAHEDQVAAWVKFIDQWVATANEGVAQAEEQRWQTANSHGGVDETKKRLTEADKYRHL